MKIKIEILLLALVLVGGLLWKLSRPTLDPEPVALQKTPAPSSASLEEPPIAAPQKNQAAQPVGALARDCTIQLQDSVYVLRGSDYEKLLQEQSTLEVEQPVSACWSEGVWLLLTTRDTRGARAYRASAQVIQVLPNRKAKLQVYDPWLGNMTILPRYCAPPCNSTLRHPGDLEDLGSNTTVFFFVSSPDWKTRNPRVGAARAIFIEPDAGMSWSTNLLEKHKNDILDRHVIFSFDLPYSIYDSILSGASIYARTARARSITFFYTGLFGLSGLPFRPPVPPGAQATHLKSALALAKRDPQTLFITFSRPSESSRSAQLPFNVKNTVISLKTNRQLPISYNEALLGGLENWKQRFDLTGFDLRKPQKVIIVGQSNFDWNAYHFSRMLLESGWKEVSIIRGGLDEIQSNTSQQ